MERLPYLGICFSLSALLVGCGGGGGGGDDGGGSSGGEGTSGEAQPGLYTGSLRGSADSQLLLAVGPNGGGQFVNEGPNTYASGTMQFNSGEFEGTIDQFQLGRPIATGELSGTSTTKSFSGKSYRLNSDGQLVEDGTFEFMRLDPLSDRPTSLTNAQGTWTDIRTASPTTTINVDANGAISGGDTNCTFTGSMSVPDSTINLYAVNFEATQCQDDADYPNSGFTAEEQQGSYDGFAYYAPAQNSDPEKLVLLVDNEKVSRYFVFEK